jgi:tRNA threonylcarbamoyladenosine biosynthesis protein TsaB
VTLRGWGTAHPAEADARRALALPTMALRAEATPVYGRLPDAKPQATAA